MSELDNLHTASVYLNNQLLARGLIRDGYNISFHNPGDDDEMLAETMSRIMSVLNDLILRRDRDAEHRESLSAILRTLRAENLRQTNDIQKLNDRVVDANRRANIAEASEEALQSQLQSAESTIRGLKEELARAKSMVGQTRASCATEIRRRDKQIDALKRQLGETSRTRGASKSSAVTVISVTGDLGEEVPKTFSSDSTLSQTISDTNSSSLNNETNEFLTNLTRKLREENTTVLSLITRTRDCLVEMTRWEKPEMPYPDSHIAVQSNYEELEYVLDGVLEHLRTILTNPSFVPIEEVEVREDEIGRLREGWERMEMRWKEAVHLIDGWRRRMATSGRPINEEELKMGLRLSPVRVRNVEETYHASVDLGVEKNDNNEEEEAQYYGEDHEMNDDSEEDRHHRISTPTPGKSSLQLVPAPTYDGMSEDEDEIYEDYDEEEPNVEILQQSIAHIPARPGYDEEDDDHSPIVIPARASPLKEITSANCGSKLSKPPHKDVGFTEDTESHDAATQDDNEEDSILPIKVPSKPLQPPVIPPTKKQPEPASKPTATKENKPAKPTTKQTTRTVTKTTMVKTRPAAVSKASRTETADSTDDSAKAISKPAARPRTPAPKTRRPISLIRNTPAAETMKPTTQKPDIKAPISRQNSTKTSILGADKPALLNDKKLLPKAIRPGSKPSSQANTLTEAVFSRSDVDNNSDTGSMQSIDSMQSSTGRSPHRKQTNANGTLRLGSTPSRLPLPRGPGSQQSPISISNIATKLAASGRDADAARVQAKLKAVRLGKGTTPVLLATKVTGASAPSDLTGDQDPLKRDAPAGLGHRKRKSDQFEEAGAGEEKIEMAQEAEPVVKRKRERRVSKVAVNRRRSTLTPVEFDALLMNGGAGTGTEENEKRN